MKFKGKKSILFYGLLVLFLFVFVDIIKAPTGLLIKAINVVVFGGTILFLGAILFQNYVLLEDGKLQIVFGCIKKQMAIADIVSLNETHNPLSSLAASFDRIEIQTKNDDVLISLVEKEKFYRALQNINPNIQIKTAKN